MFCVPGKGHIQRLLPLIGGLSSQGHTVHVLTHLDHKERVESSGGHFLDLLGPYPSEAIDNESMPNSCRHVSFAGHYAESIAVDVERLNPSLVIYDSYAVIGPAVGKLLGLPYVCVCAGTFGPPEKIPELYYGFPEMIISAACKTGVEKLHSIGLTDATTYYYLHTMSPYLNVCSEIETFLSEDQHRFIQPAVFYGSLNLEEYDARPGAAVVQIEKRKLNSPLQVYISFGTVIWKYFEAQALAAIEALASIFASIDGVQTLISLGGWTPVYSRAVKLSSENVRVESYVDQWSVLCKPISS